MPRSNDGECRQHVLHVWEQQPIGPVHLRRGARHGHDGERALHRCRLGGLQLRSQRKPWLWLRCSVLVDLRAMQTRFRSTRPADGSTKSATSRGLSTTARRATGTCATTPTISSHYVGGWLYPTPADGCDTGSGSTTPVRYAAMVHCPRVRRRSQHNGCLQRLSQVRGARPAIYQRPLHLTPTSTCCARARHSSVGSRFASHQFGRTRRNTIFRININAP